MIGDSVAQWIDGMIDRYPSGYLEVLASVSVQLIYLMFGFIVEWVRPSYKSETSRKMLLHSMRNHIVATLTHVLYVMYRHGESVLTRTFYSRPYQLPLWTELVGQLVVGLVLRDVVFYAIHRVWHLPFVYQWVHAKHHEVKEPNVHHVLTISYMTVTDFMFLYGLPVIAVAKFLEMNILTTMAFSFVSAVGEQIKIVYGNEGHDEHHMTLAGEYGVYGLMDGLFSGKPTTEKVKKAA